MVVPRQVPETKLQKHHIFTTFILSAFASSLHLLASISSFFAGYRVAFNFTKLINILLFFGLSLDTKSVLPSKSSCYRNIRLAIIGFTSSATFTSLLTPRFSFYFTVQNFKTSELSRYCSANTGSLYSIAYPQT